MGGAKKMAAVAAVIVTFAAGTYSYQQIQESRRRPDLVRTGQRGGINAFTLHSATGKTQTHNDLNAPPPPFEGIGLRGTSRIQIGAQLTADGGATAAPVEQQLFPQQKTTGDILVQRVSSAEGHGSVIYFRFATAEEAEAALQSALRSEEGKMTEVRRRGNCVAVVLGGGRTAEQQLAFRTAIASALDAQPVS